MPDGWTYLARVMKPVINVEETPGKVVGRRVVPADGLAPSPAQTARDARAWQRAFQTGRVPKGVYRFRTHEEADEWLWKMLTRPRH
jgi:hypothetical protein